MPGPALQLLLGLDWGASGHVVAVVGAVVVVVVEPGLQGSVEQGEVVDAAAVEMWSVELAQDGAVEAFTDRVVVRGAWRDPVVDQIQGGPGGSEVLAGELGSVVGQDSFEGAVCSVWKPLRKKLFLISTGCSGSTAMRL